ncbi:MULTISPECIES: Cof-type HAD-IIB family hydrolase [unclassified Sphingomonas]|jgi:Cof subfamily protein (haloacid dehalogenase superfamily)|uniref:Cof-type HAD-IIB family hydrolase n=1 Tax=unclassified Sphingomonas TaxID=196159 RepID=UPI000E106B72|nr:MULTISPECIES: Cof-type HAD-IIB family hydrolase [unclassified Sphingomonas]AXJ94664.1 hydrolase Cof [Sphingomonas sp. FARSPH]
MSPIRLVVSDIDGTLVDKGKQLTPATADAVLRLEQAGVGFSVISARPRSGIMPIAQTLGIDAPMAAFNGGIIFRRDGTVEEHHVVDPDVVRAVMDVATDAKVDTWVFADDRWYASTDEGEHVAHERLASNQDPVVTTDFAPYLDHADKVTFVSDDHDLLKSLADRCKSFADRATIVQSQVYYLDVTALAGNKGDGARALARAFDVPLDATVAIGDQFNDVPMLDIAGFSIAMGNAPDAVKAKADAVTRANDADGVAYAIDTLIFPRIGVSA